MAGDPAAPDPYAAPQPDLQGRPPAPRAAPLGLRITAGVVLLLAASLDLVGGLGYVAGGLVASRKAGASSANIFVGAVVIFGMVGAMITSAVFLFQGKRGRFVLVVASLLGAVAAAGAAMWGARVPIALVPLVSHLAVAILAFLAAVAVANHEAGSRRNRG